MHSSAGSAALALQSAFQPATQVPPRRHRHHRPSAASADSLAPCQKLEASRSSASVIVGRGVIQSPLFQNGARANIAQAPAPPHGAPATQPGQRFTKPSKPTCAEALASRLSSDDRLSCRPEVPGCLRKLKTNRHSQEASGRFWNAKPLKLSSLLVPHTAGTSQASQASSAHRQWLPQIPRPIYLASRSRACPATHLDLGAPKSSDDSAKARSIALQGMIEPARFHLPASPAGDGHHNSGVDQSRAGRLNQSTPLARLKAAS